MLYEVITECGLQIRLQPTIVLHSIGQRVADDDDVVSLLKLYGGGGAGGRAEYQGQ